MKNTFVILIFFIPLLSYTQTKGVGYSSVYSLKDKVNAFNEALFNAQENAAINSGGNIGRVSTDVGTDVISENNMRKTEASYNSKKIDLRSRMIKAVVTTIGDPTCDTIWLKSKHYKVKITGEFNVNHEQVDFLLPDLETTGEKIKIEVQENDCYGRFYDYAFEYFRQKQNSIFLSRQKFPLGETDFGIEVFSDRITLVDKKTFPNNSIKVFKVNSCNDVIIKDYDNNIILDSIRKEIFFYYLMRKI